MSYFGVSTRNGVGLGLGTVPSLTNTPLGYRLAPSLDLSFAGSDTLSPAITFSRTTNATLTNSAGLVANAPMNLLTFSEQFDNAAWNKSATTVTANAVVAPNGTTTADTLTSDGTSTQHNVSAAPTLAATTAYAFSVYAKAGTTNFLQITTNLTAGSANHYANFNLQTGVVSAVGSSATATIAAVGNGWYRCTAVMTTLLTSASATFILIPVDSGTATRNPTFSTVTSVQLWGAQLELGSTATTYNPTTVKNLLGFTENFDNAAWTKSNASISATKVDDIYGQPFAQQVTSSASNGTVLSTYTAVASTPYTFSIWMKRVTGTGNIDISADGTTWATRTLTTEWQRFSVTASPTAGSKTPGVRIATSGDSIYIFGAQLSDSASVDPYVYQPVAAPTSTAYYGPRFDYDPVTLAPKGLLIEEQRTNLLLNSAVLNTQVVTTTATAHTLSFYGTGTIVLSGASTGTVVGTGAYPTRTTLTFTPIVGVLTVTVTGSVTMAQLEAGAFATSYIPTVASQVTRAADAASMIGNNFARWYNQTEGTVYAAVRPIAQPAAGKTARFLEINDGTANGRNPVFFGNNNAGVVTADVQYRLGGVIQASFQAVTTSFLANTLLTVASAYKQNDFATSFNGTTAITDTSGSVLSGAVELNIGYARSAPGEPLNGTVSRIAYYNRRLSNTELQGITS